VYGFMIGMLTVLVRVFTPPSRKHRHRHPFYELLCALLDEIQLKGGYESAYPMSGSLKSLLTRPCCASYAACC